MRKENKRLKRKEVYIPIEIKAREFASQVYLAGALARKGARVFVGSKSSVDRLVNEKRNKQGVYLYKGGGSRVEKFRNALKRVTSIAVLDQEVSPALKNYDYIKIRFVAGSLKYVSRLYYVGREAKEAAIRCLEGIDSNRIKDFGWPRVDLWMPSKSYIWNDDIKKIHDEFGDEFLLFSSDFGINSQRLLDERSLRLELVGAKKTKDELEFMRKQQEDAYRNFNRFVEFLHEIDADARLPLIIIRPHPGEDHKVWLDKTSELKNIKTVYRGDITPWLLASKGLLHRGCTTAIQAAISQVKTGFLTNYSDAASNSIVPRLSPELYNLEEVVTWANSAENTLNHEESQEILSEHVNFPAQGATEKIAEDLITLAGDAVTQSNVRTKSLTKRVLAKLVDKYRRRNKKEKNPHGLGKLPKYNKMQDGINSLEVENKIKLMYLDGTFKVNQVIGDLCLIEIDVGSTDA